MKNEAHKGFHQKLLEQQKELRGLLGRFAAKDPHVKDEFQSRFPDYGASQEDNATEVADYEDELSIEQDLERALRDVDAALDRVAHETYGQCSVCGKAIEVERLRLLPATTLCIEHKSTTRS